ncbi:hypothetical protein [Acidovorax lacteus]|uniref:WD40 repeat domain-containing protein n=1 Tax=Acidovorax lacteus TaxID=1924988 RepID=A0ABP8LH98_9BURK
MTRREWRLALPILALLALCAFGYLRGMRMEMSVDGHMALRTARAAGQPERLALVADGALHVLDAQGQRLSRQPFSMLGLAESPSDIDWALDPQTQRWQLWLYEDRGPSVLRCWWDEALHRLLDCSTAISGSHLKITPRSRAVHIAVDPAGPRLFVADAQGHAVQVFDAQGRLLGRSDPTSAALWYPNRLRYLGNQQLLVADNDHRRLVWLQVPSQGAVVMQRSLYSRSHPQARTDRGKVADAAEAPDGTLWMLAVAQGQRRGDILIFDRAQRPVARAALPTGADPLLLDTLGGVAVVGDFAGLDLYRVDGQGQWLGRFGDTALHAELQLLRDQRRYGAWWKRASLALGGLVMLAGFGLALRYGQPLSSSPAAVAGRRLQEAWWADIDAQAADHGELHYPVVLAVRPSFWRLMVGSAVAGAVLLPAATGLWLWGGPGGISPERLSPGLMPLLCLWLGILGILQYLWRLRQRSLRITERRVGWFDGQRLLAQAPLDEVRASPQGMLVGAYRIPLGPGTSNPRWTPWNTPLLAAALLARLPAQARVSDLQLTRLWWQRQPVAARAVLVLLPALLLAGLWWT